MRGKDSKQSSMLCLMSPDGMVPERHPVRRIKKLADECLAKMSSTFDAMYAGTGRPSIPPERLLKASLLMALYSVRSERQFTEQLGYNLLFRWFLDMDMVEPTFDATTFTKNRERLLAHDAAGEFFRAVVEQARRGHLMSSEHFTVDGTLIEAWASLKSFKKKDAKDDGGPPDDPGNPTVNFHGEKRSNETHASTTDPEAKLARKGRGVSSRRLLFVDVETTGLDPTRHEIIELAALRVHPTLLYVEGELVTRVRPRHPERCSVETAALNGFDPAAWDDAPALEDALERFVPLATGCILAGHNVAFDRAFLASGFRRAGLEEPKMDHHVIDTASLAWPLVAVGALDSLSLGPVCDLLGIRNEGAHSARRDVAYKMEVYRRLMALRMAMPPGAWSPSGVGDEDAILATQAARLAEGRHTYGTWRVSDGRNNTGEALLEVMDALNYCAAELLRLARTKGEVA